MRNHITFFVMIILLIRCSSPEHLLFNNVPIDGHLNKFAGELTKLGFILSDTTKINEIKLRGEFLNRDCEILVYGTDKNNDAYKVIVELPKEGHDSLQFRFGKIQQQFSSKYGIGKSRYQQYRKRESFMFNVPRLKRDIRKGDFTEYTTDSGYITLEVREGYMSITYLDKMNYEMMKKEMKERNIEEINEDI